MKNVGLFGLGVLLLAMVSCQSDRETEQTPAPVVSSVYREDATATGTSSASAQTASATSTQQQEILTYINQARSQTCLCGSTVYPPVPALTLDGQLNVAADKFALDMATYNYFSHTGRDGSQPWDRVTREGYNWRAVGENIAAGQTTTRATVDAWLKSEGHCKNIMSANFSNVGVGYAYTASSTYKHYWVTDFGTRR
jgi:uncharacterized protein YkwD